MSQICGGNLSGVNFINVLRTAFTHVAPQIVRTQSIHKYLFTLLGSTCVKAVCRMLMKLTTVVRLIDVAKERHFQRKD